MVHLYVLCMWLIATLAQATPYDVSLCQEVDILFDNGGDGGDNWISDTEDKPARGFFYMLFEDSSGIFNVLVDSGYFSDSGGTVGCTGTHTLDSGKDYLLATFSEALVDGHTIIALDDDTNEDLAVAEFYFSPTANGEIPATVLPGATDMRWNHLAIAAFALYFEGTGLSAETLTLYSNDGDTPYATANSVYLDDSTTKFTITHEIGHWVSYRINGGNLPVKNYFAVTGSDPGDEEGCDGTSNGGIKHGTITKEFYSTAFVEGIADWYAALVWNDIGIDAPDCTYARGHDIDWDLDTIVDHQDGFPYPCTGSPKPGVAWVSADDWLEDAINEGAGSCTGYLARMNTQYDIIRYLFALRTEEDLTKQKIWDIWDDANPDTWDPDGGGSTNDDPEVRWEAAADSNTVGGAHDDQKHHGLDH